MNEEAPRILDCRGRQLPLGGCSRFMGIVNVTPDSFYEGGRHEGAQAAQRARTLVAEGAELIDLGGESTRPGHKPVSAHDEWARLCVPLDEILSSLEVPVSIDTRKPEVAKAALERGAHLVNDVEGLQGDPAMARVAAQFGCPVIVMHNEAGFPSRSGDPIEGMLKFFERSLAIAQAAGLPRNKIVIDPGIGFAKTAEQSLEVMGRLDELRTLGLPILLGASRKSSIGQVLNLPPDERLEGTLATTVLAVTQGVELIRVHDVLPNLRAARVAEAVLKSAGKRTA